MERLSSVADEVQRPLQCFLTSDIGLVYALREPCCAIGEDGGLVGDLLSDAAVGLAVAIVVDITYTGRLEWDYVSRGESHCMSERVNLHHLARR